MAKTTPIPAILGTGRRKTSVARVRLTPGSGVIIVAVALSARQDRR